MKYQGKTFRNETIRLDGNEFDGCTFENCEFIYRGTAQVDFTNCSISRPVLTFDGEAARTLDFLKVLYHSGFQSIIDYIFNNIRGGGTPSHGGETTH
jgi:hypothetical protein